MKAKGKGKRTRLVLASLVLASLVLGLWSFRSKRSSNAPRAHVSEAADVDGEPEKKNESAAQDDGAPVVVPASPRRRGFELGQRLFIPRPATPSGAEATAPATHHPRQLAPRRGDLVDRTDGGADWPALKSELEARIAEVHASTAHCLDGYANEDPSLAAGVVLSISVDEQGLQKVWIDDRADAPSGALACLSNAVYPIDWGGLTKASMRLTVKVGYAASDAGTPADAAAD